jgi:hypothetical protein
MNTKKETKPEIQFSDELYLVDVTIWEHGTGKSFRDKVLCSDLETAVIVCQGLKKIYPQSLNVNSGDRDGINRTVSITISPARRCDAERFVKERDW